MEKPSNTNHKEIIKKLKEYGLKSFSDREVLELLLTFSTSKQDTKKLSLNLIKSFGSFKNVLDANSFELQETEDLNSQSAMLINMVREIITRYSYGEIKKRKRALNKEECFDYCTTHLQNKKQEFFEVLLLDKKKVLISAEVITEGNVDSASVSFRKIIELVFKHNAKFVICVHNHPSGNPEPSEEDKHMTKQLKIVLQNLEVPLIDHLIVGEGKIYSIETKSYIEKPKILL